MTDLQNLLDEIDRLELEVCPGPWVANDLGIGYEITTQQHMPINSVIKDTFQRSDAKFIALARTFAPAASRALRAVMQECERLKAVSRNTVHEDSPARHIVRANAIRQAADGVLEVLHDAMEDVADGQALDQARAEDDGTRITLDKYLEDDGD